MKILYVIDSLCSGGKERRLISLMKEFVLKDNIQIELVILSKVIFYEEIHDLDVKIHYLEKDFTKDIGIFSKFNNILNRSKPDIVHCWHNIAAFHFAPICKFKGIPFINSMITTAPPLLSRFSKLYFFYAFTYPFSDEVLANSKAGLKSFRVPEKKARYIYNGFDFSRKKIKVDSDKIREKFNVKTKYIVGMTGAFYDRKDHKTFIDAAEMVLKNRNDVTFILIGDGPNLEKFKNSVQRKNENNFKFLGKQIDVESIVNTFNIGVLSSYTEGISNAIMEYMIFEKPVIATDGGGTNELILDNETGFLIDIGNSNQLYEKIIFLLENEKLAKEMGAKGKERIENNFSIYKMIDSFSQLYNSYK